MEENKHLKQNSKLRKKLRVVGIIFVILGAILFAMSIVGMNSFNEKLSMLGFAAIPCLFIGTNCMIFGFMGAISRYTASESAPIMKDTKNYMEEQTREERVKTVSEMADQIKNGQKMICTYCQETNDVDAKFCKKCGAPLVKVCSCGTKNPVDALFCKACGKRL